MAFDPTKAINPRWSLHSGSLLIKWDSTAASGTYFQVYLNGKLAWVGAQSRCIIPYLSGITRADIGAVLPGEKTMDLSAQIPPRPGGARTATLSWDGGTFLSLDIAAFDIYGPPETNSPTRDASGDGYGDGLYGYGGYGQQGPVARVAATPDNVSFDGYGYGGYGSGGWGYASTTYSWVTPSMPVGTWEFAIVPVDSFGVEGDALAMTVVIDAPPRPPVDLVGTYDQGAGTTVLSWSPSPDALVS